MTSRCRLIHDLFAVDGNSSAENEMSGHVVGEIARIV
jgi:hypothetical protein